MTNPVRKAVIPAAGLGTRFLPATKSQPKEMLPVVDKPSIQYVVEEAVRRRAHRHPRHHRPGQAGDRGPLRPQLRARVLPGAGRGTTELLKEVQAISELGRHPLHPPARPARPRPRGVGGPRARRQRAVRGPARRRHHGRRRRGCSARCSTSTSATAARCSRVQEVAPGRDLVLRLRRRPKRSRRTSSGCGRSSRSRSRRTRRRTSR